MASEEIENDNKPQRGKTSILRYSGLGMQIALIIGLGSWFGSWLDDQFPMEKNWFSLAMVLLSVSFAMYYAIKTLNRLNK